jgi:hypothetical protein
MNMTVHDSAEQSCIGGSPLHRVNKVSGPTFSILMEMSYEIDYFELIRVFCTDHLNIDYDSWHKTMFKLLIQVRCCLFSDHFCYITLNPDVNFPKTEDGMAASIPMKELKVYLIL